MAGTGSEPMAGAAGGARAAGAPDELDPIPCSANVGFLFRGQPLAAALASAAAAGFRTVELTDPYAIPPATIRDDLDRLGLRVGLLNFPLGDFAAGERGFAGDPTRRADFRRALALAAEYVAILRPAKLNVLAGRAVDGVPLGEQLDCVVESLGAAADRFAGDGVEVVTELLNPVETPGFLLADLVAVRGVLDRLSGRVGFQLDVYHLQRSGGELIPSIQAMAAHTRHVQVADAPGRTEPGSGEINIPNVLAAIRASGYRGCIGLEYIPTGPATAFAWMPAARCVPA